MNVAELIFWKALVPFTASYLGAMLFYRLVGVHHVRAMRRESFDEGARQMMRRFPEYASEWQEQNLAGSLEALHSIHKGQDREEAIKDAVARRRLKDLPRPEDLPNRP